MASLLFRSFRYRTMSLPSHPDPVKLVASLISSGDQLFPPIIGQLENVFGAIDCISRILPFDYTDYYRAEMGAPLRRRFISFASLIPPGRLPDIKAAANRLEGEYARDGKRQVNIDPGYLSTGHLLLATGKPYAHRPYLRDGVYADLTLIYRDGAFHALEWTYPDYQDPLLAGLLDRIRERYLKELATLKKETGRTG